MSGNEADDEDLLAAEYALGTLNLAEMRQAEARAARDPAFAADILRWQDRLSPMSALVPSVQPPPALWSRLALATGIGSHRSSNARGWRAATAVSLALAASLAVVAFLPRLTPAPSATAWPQFAAALTPLATPARFLATTRLDGSIAVTSVGDASVPIGRDYQLWALPQGTAVPVSLGLLAPGQVVVAPGHAAPQEQLLVSEEPSGGSTTGAPTGPVVLGGTLQAVQR